jgi:UDP-GlcNAc:undecaprenyl-phosphate GlcNAc-1-phosphate transferase
MKLFLLFVCQFFLNLILLKYYKNIAYIINSYDCPDSIRKFHQKPVPVIGGFFFLINIILFFPFLFNLGYLDKYFFFGTKNLYIFLIFFSIFFLVGFIDDKKNLSPKLRLILTSISCFLIIYYDQSLIIKSINFFNLKISFNNYFISIIFTVFCIVVLINALNMIDGINLQFSLFCILIFFILFFKNQSYIYLFSIISLTFICYLNSSSKIFLGDAGTYSISFFLAYLFLKLFNNHLINENEIIFMLIIPGLDLIRVFFIRIISMKNPFRGDRNHLHHYLSEIANNKTCLIIFLFLSIVPTLLNFFFKGWITLFFSVLIYFFTINLIKNLKNFLDLK